MSIGHSNALKQYDNFMDGFYISPSFLDKLAVHITKNFVDLPKIKVRKGGQGALLLGIWSGKGLCLARKPFKRPCIPYLKKHAPPPPPH